MGAGRILVVDDDLGFLKSLEAVLVRSGFEVSAVSSVPEALHLIGSRPFDVLLSDMNIGEPGDGFTVVSAMRRVQPKACTFILTGYPDIDSAVRAIRSQVDDYFSKPLKVEDLLAAISFAKGGNKRETKPRSLRKVSDLVRESSSSICERWYEEVMREPELAALPLSKQERIDHVPDLLDQLVRRLERETGELNHTSVEAARKHGKARFQQGYTIPQILFETRKMQQVISSVIQENLITIELSTLVGDILEIGESLQAEVEISIRTYQTQVPPSIQSSLSSIYKSPYLGVVIADEEHVIDANDAFLKMIGFTREQLNKGEIDWRALTPEKYRHVDTAAVEQLREFGTCAPVEKEFVLPDGSALPFLISAVRLSIEPFQWSAYVVNLTEQRRVQAAERKIREWEARYLLINHLAHEVNNPLAALVFTLHLLRTHPDLSDDVLKMIEDANEMLERISGTVREVLIESQT